MGETIEMDDLKLLFAQTFFDFLGGALFVEHYHFLWAAILREVEEDLGEGVGWMEVMKEFLSGLQDISMA